MKIITHGGKAHADEIMAIALIMIKENVASHDVDIVRSTDNRRAREYEDADFVVDTGGDYDPRKNWFDHHQFPCEARPACSFTLVARKYKLDMTKFPWSEKLAIIDSKGQRAWFESIMGRNPKNGREMVRANGIDSSIFKYVEDLGNKDFITGVVFAKDWLELQIHNAEEHAKALDYALSISKTIDLDTFKMAYFETKDPRGVLSATDKLAENDPLIIVSGMLDERSEGYSAVRMNDDERVDFSPLAKEDGCIFAHNSGFMVKWRNNWEEFLEAIRRSVK